MTPANSNEVMRCENITVRLIWGLPVSGFPLKTENMNGELFVNELIICFVDLSTELQIGGSYLPFAPAHQ